MINTTSETIAEHRAATLKRLADDSAYSVALEADAEAQRAAESDWLENRAVFRGAKRFVTNTFATPPATAKARHHWPSVPNASPAAAIAAATFAAVAPFAESVLAENMFLAAIAAARRGNEAAMDSGQYAVATPIGDSDASISDLKHEAVVGLFGTNKLRAFVPNFPYVYAYIQAPFVQSIQSRTAAAARAASPRRRRGDKAKPISAIADSSVVEELPALIRESVSGVPVLDAIAAGTFAEPRDFAELVLQLAYALKFAHEEVGFTHYDLSPTTVTLRAIEGIDPNGADRAYIPYELGKVYVAARSVATLSGFGFSHITAANSLGKRVAFGFAAAGRAELVELGIFRDRKNPMTDIYRFMLACALVAPPDSVVRTVVAVLIGYFNQTEALASILEKQRGNYYYLPLTATARAYCFDEFIAHVKTHARTNNWVTDIKALVVSPSSPSGPPRRVANRVAAMQFPGPWGSATGTVPTATTDTLATHHFMPRTFREFADTYTAINVRIDSDADVATMKALTSAFIKGFSEDSSLFNGALDSLQQELEDLAAIVRRALTGVYERSEHTVPPGKLVSKLLATHNPKAAVMTPDTSAMAVEVATAYTAMLDAVRAVATAAGIYWSGISKDVPPAHVAAAISSATAEVAEVADIMAVLNAAVNADFARAVYATDEFSQSMFSPKVSAAAVESRLAGAAEACAAAAGPQPIAHDEAA
jgi:hypothetical protein